MNPAVWAFTHCNAADADVPNAGGGVGGGGGAPRQAPRAANDIVAAMLAAGRRTFIVMAMVLKSRWLGNGARFDAGVAGRIPNARLGFLVEQQT